MYTVECYGYSDIGLKRANNEDAFVLDLDLGFFALADGMGGAASGEIASKTFAETVSEVFSKNEKQSERDILELVQNAFRLANERVLDLAENNIRHHGMGCTAELIAFDGQKFVLGHVGDSRSYLLRHGQLKQLTHDHSLVQGHIDRGTITKYEARKSSKRNIILRAVGTNETLSVDLIRGKFLPGDGFLLCSDGLTDMVDDSDIENTLTSSSENVSKKVEHLINLANEAGGKDNITVVLCEIIEQ
ncbi:MAG: Stp1/IreP family PP2C-type Ser/Thr phosphatase [Planctomycetes bacterium]|nr:Stp1/IreP family PP2C-type Ser/Thr phosphatase [Planctomycetota bacterium]